MGLQYELVQALLVLEMVIFAFLLLPFPASWRKNALIYISRYPTPRHFQTALYVVFSLIALLFCDSLNRSIKTSHISFLNPVQRDFHGSHDFNARMFYAQRNMYLTGFTLFLSLILRSFLQNSIKVAQADERIDVVRRQAGSQMKEYERILDESVSQDAVIKDLRGQITKLEEQVKASAAKVKNSEILVKQAEATRKEYMRLSDDYASMEKRIGLTGPAETKKDA